MKDARSYVCPRCGYDGFTASKPTGTGSLDFNIQWFCPICATTGRGCMALVETSDPRTTA